MAATKTALIALRDGSAGLRKYAQDNGIGDDGTVDFSEADLSGYSLGNLQFPFRPNFSKCTFGTVYFASCEFTRGATFDDAIFKGELRIELRNTHSDLSFKRTVFKGDVWVNSWGGADLLWFSGARFEGQLNSMSLGHQIHWPYPNFDQALFVGDVCLENCSIVGADFSRANFQKPDGADGNGDNRPSRTIFSNSTFLQSVTFSQATFWRMAVFENAKFLGSTSFRHARFHVAPEFHSAELHQDTQFSRPDQFPDLFLDTSSNGAAEAYRTLKLAMNKQHALSEESAFFLLEMRSRARLERWPRWIMFSMYDILSVYGQSVWRPVFWLILVTCFFGLLYSCLTGERFETFDPQIFALTLFGAVPFVGTLHWSEITHGGEPIFPQAVLGYVQIALVAQAIISAILLFLIGLGLRNLFKIR